MANNVQTIQVDAGAYSTAHILISGSTHAAFHQRVIVNVENSDGSQTHTFNGSGEGTPFGSSFTLDSVKLPATITFTFEYSQDGSNYYPSNRSEQDPMVNQPAIKVYSVFSEDSTDNDDNDSYMYASIHMNQ